jgi:hypothetical protein
VSSTPTPHRVRAVAFPVLLPTPAVKTRPRSSVSSAPARTSRRDTPCKKKRSTSVSPTVLLRVRRCHRELETRAPVTPLTPKLTPPTRSPDLDVGWSVGKNKRSPHLYNVLGGTALPCVVTQPAYCCAVRKVNPVTPPQPLPCRHLPQTISKRHAPGSLLKVVQLSSFSNSKFEAKSFVAARPVWSCNSGSPHSLFLRTVSREPELFRDLGLYKSTANRRPPRTARQSDSTLQQVFTQSC